MNDWLNIDRMIDRMIDPVIDRMMDRMIDNIVDWSIDNPNISLATLLVSISTSFSSKSIAVGWYHLLYWL